MRLLLALLVAALGSACVATPLGTARTLAEGEMHHEVGLAAASVVKVPEDDEEEDPREEDTRDFLLVPMASWTGRVGLADGVELGLGVQTIGVHADVKLALLRTEGLALAVAPGLAANVGSLYSLAAPLLLDLELGRDVTLVLAASPTFAFGTPGFDRSWSLLGFGTGLVVRFSDSFALQPGVQTLVPLHNGGLIEDRPLVFGGLGFLIGPRPAGR